ncbi:MAG: hypothetical protein R1F54_05275 [Candidatus Zeuxoniibacter abyssi]|nr:MAG: hypothetical protein R1F54_05275 [Candidatus Persebacteraceae bacterium AB1(2)]
MKLISLILVSFLFVVPAFALFALLIVTLASLSVTEATSEIISLPNAPISWIEYGIAIGLIILVGVSAVWYFYSRRVPIHKIWGRSMCLFSFVWFLSAVVFAVSWYLDVYFIGQFFEGEENPVLAIHLFVFSIYKMLIYGLLGLVIWFWGRWRLLPILLSLFILPFTIGAVAWANSNNISMNCFVNGDWEGSPLIQEQLAYFDAIDAYPSDKMIPAIINISSLYLSGPLISGDGCYTSDDKTRFKIMEKMIFYYPDFVEIRPTTLQEQISLASRRGGYSCHAFVCPNVCRRPRR